MITEFERDGTSYRVFDDITEVFETCPRTPGCENVNESWRRNERFIGEEFTVWQQVLDKAKKPCPKVTQAVEEMIEKLEDIDIPHPMVHKRRPRFKNDDGDEIDLDRLRGGQDYWRVCERQASVGSQVKTIVVNMSTRYSVDVDQIHWRGAAAIVLCHLLEAAGYQCEIWAIENCVHTYCGDVCPDQFSAVKLKDSFGAIDIDTLSTVVSGWFFRSVWFALKEMKGKRTKGGLGGPRSITRRHLDDAGLHVSAADTDLIIVQDVFSEYSAANLVKDALGQYAEPHVDEEVYDEPVDVYEPTPYIPPPPAPPKTAAQRRREEAEDRKSEREYQKRRKAWQKQDRAF